MPNKCSEGHFVVRSQIICNLLRSCVCICICSLVLLQGLALRYAQRGASLVLAARSKECLEETKRECVQLGAAGCLVVPTDVTNEQVIN